MAKTIFDDFEKNREYTIERLNKIPSAISLFSVSSEIRFLHFNKSADKVLSYEPGGLMKITASDPLKILHHDHIDQFYSEIISTMRDGRFFNYNCRLLCADGTYKWINISAELVRQSGGTLYYHGVLTEIPEPDNILLRGLHALIASEDDSDRIQLSHLIEEKGGTCDTFEYGTDVLDRFETSEPGFYQCILVGNRMKDINGLELIKDIRFCRHPQASTIPLILLIDDISKGSNEEDTHSDILEEAKSFSITSVLSKPLNLEALPKALAALIPEKI